MKHLSKLKERIEMGMRKRNKGGRGQVMRGVSVEQGRKRDNKQKGSEERETTERR